MVLDGTSWTFSRWFRCVEGAFSEGREHGPEGHPRGIFWPTEASPRAMGSAGAEAAPPPRPAVTIGQWLMAVVQVHALLLLRAAGGFCDSKCGLFQRARHLHNHTRPRTLDPCVEVFTRIHGGSLCSPSEHCFLPVFRMDAIMSCVHSEAENCSRRREHRRADRGSATAESGRSARSG